MKSYEPIAVGTVKSLCLNGEPAEAIMFQLTGPMHDKHCGYYRNLSGHDGDYIRTSGLKRGDRVFNWRTWTGIEESEIKAAEEILGLPIPQGILLENITFSGIPDFSSLAPTSRLVFPHHGSRSQAMLAIWEQNGPCKTVGTRLADHHGDPDLMTRLVQAAQGKRGVMGIVLSAGHVRVGDEVRVFPPNS